MRKIEALLKNGQFNNRCATLKSIDILITCQSIVNTKVNLKGQLISWVFSKFLKSPFRNSKILFWWQDCLVIRETKSNFIKNSFCRNTSFDKKGKQFTKVTKSSLIDNQKYSISFHPTAYQKMFPIYFIAILNHF